MKEIGADGFAAPMKVTCDDHNGHNSAYMARWDGTKWTQGLGLDRADQDEGPSADRVGGEGLFDGQRRLAEAHGTLRQVIVST